MGKLDLETQDWARVMLGMDWGCLGSEDLETAKLGWVMAKLRWVARDWARVMLGMDWGCLGSEDLETAKLGWVMGKLRWAAQDLARATMGLGCSGLEMGSRSDSAMLRLLPCLGPSAL